MPNPPPWQFDEFKQLTVDFNDPQQVADYDRRQGDGAEDNRRILSDLGLKAGDVVVDLGTGTGSFAVEAARAGAARVHAVDVSPAMLEFTKRRARAAGVEDRITCTHAGFLSYAHAGPPADIVVTQFAMHHLPDFWKGVALARIAAFIKPGGRFYLEDVIFSFPSTDHAARIDSWIDTVAGARGGNSFGRAVFQGHVRDEFSTYDWVIEGLLSRAGLRIDAAHKSAPTYATYTCARVG
jgi:cyclopropane fatty-acyl-phospholipid synthase-like methyltransferase